MPSAQETKLKTQIFESKLPSITTIDRLADDLQWCGRDENGTGRRGALFWTGAGCSVSAGIPSAYEISKKLTSEVARIKLQKKIANVISDEESRGYYSLLQQHFPSLKDLSIENAYGALFEIVRLPNLQRDFLRQFIVPSVEGPINWAHACLGELTRQNYIHTVMSTNFDLLALRGMTLAGVTPVVCDGFESLNRLRPKADLIAPQLFHVHGSLHSYSLLNTKQQMNSVLEDQGSYSVLRQLFLDSDVVVIVGYRGSDDEGLMTALTKMASSVSNTTFYWVSFTDKFADMSQSAQSFLTADSSRRQWLAGWDADEFFLELMKRLSIGAPEWIANPIQHMHKKIKNVAYDQVSDLVKPILDLAKSTLQEIEFNNLTHGKDGYLLKLKLKGSQLVREELIGRPLTGSDEKYELWARMEAAYSLSDQFGIPAYLSEGEHDANYLLKNSKYDLSHDQKSKILHAKARALSSAGELTINSIATQQLSSAIDAITTAFGYDCEYVKTHKSKLTLVQATAKITLGKRNKNVEKIRLGCGDLQRLLESLDRQKNSAEWIRVAINLGNGLRADADRSADFNKLEGAYSLFSQVKDLISVASHPNEWAALHNNYGNVNRALYYAHNDVDFLNESLENCNEALRVREHSKAREPRKWLFTKVNLAEALLCLGNHHRDASHLKQAIVHYQDCMSLKELQHMEKLRRECMRGLFFSIYYLHELEQSLDNALIKEGNSLANAIVRFTDQEPATDAPLTKGSDAQKRHDANNLAAKWLLPTPQIELNYMQ
jgi:SIR2-like domain